MFQYDETIRTCWFYRTYSKYLVNSLSLFGVILSYLLLVYFYLRIFIYIYKAKQRARMSNENRKQEID